MQMEVYYVQHELIKGIARVCRDMGWDCITPSAMRVLHDLVIKRIKETIRFANVYSASAGRPCLGLAATCNALNAMGEDLAGLREFCKYMGRVSPHCSQRIPRLRGVEVGRINPDSGMVEPGFVDVHLWLNHLKRMKQLVSASDLRRSRRIQDRSRKVNGANDDAVFKKPVAPAPRAKKLLHKPS
nr:uncharacterized protein LOC106684494 isoform X2 [Halyomorpha halys]